MSNLRDAAQQALEALDAYSWEQVDAARTALRAALEQDESEGSVCIRCGALALDPLVPQQAEPVGWLAPDGSVRKTRKPKTFKEWTWGPDAYRPLYAAPPQRKPLTDDEILEMVRAAPDLGSAEDEWLHVARAIERHLTGK